ncbi:MAG TPA: alpha/beta hydrolase [Acetobacteraceae bacterium]|nr:alpha/beta hydrolase [Acetobacteraceae bacterium]
MRTTLLALGAVLLVAILAVAIWLYTPDKPRAELEARWAGPPSSFLDVAGVRLHLRDTGPRDGPAVLMLHGFGASLHTWEDWARGLEDRFRVIRFDFPGFALTGPDPSGVYTDARSVEVIAALMDRLGLPRASLVGSSMGGRIAWTFAATHPDRVERLVLLAPDGFASPGRAYGQEIRVPALMRTLPWTLPMPLLRRTAAAAFGDPSLMTDELAERYRDMLLVPGVRQAILDRTPQNTLEDPAPMLARITAPTLLVWGALDRMVPVANAADYQRLMRDTRLVTFPDVGHVPQEEAPARTLTPVQDFLLEGLVTQAERTGPATPR